MRRLSGIEIYNMPRTGKTVAIPITPGKSILVLTGYNGSGKSRLIAAVMETLSMIRDHDFPAQAQDWAMKISFEDGTEAISVKMDRGTVGNEKIASKMQGLIGKRFPLEKLYNTAKKFIANSTDKTVHTGGKPPPDGWQKNFGGVSLLNVPENIENYPSELDAVAFIDDKVFFNYERKLEKAVFKADASLDNTLMVLITEFISSKAVLGLVTGQLESSVREIMKEYLSGTQKHRKGADQEDALDFVRARLDPDALAVESEPLFSQTEVFTTLNTFFKTTKRELIWKSNKICMQLSDGSIVEWYYCSKGEKALLALFLTVYLYRDNSIFFLDEPEASLHAEWQKKILPALKELAPSAQFIVATHSPFLIMNTEHEQIVNMAKF
ncbi:AAA family ATPase [Pseudomonas sp. G.S.17]|uniref:AAA family ATPase n=1 Tax=Pseudomonas sp. G.S.17 TaxID=3137451 RepID=UPI00311CC52D